MIVTITQFNIFYLYYYFNIKIIFIQKYTLVASTRVLVCLDKTLPAWMTVEEAPLGKVPTIVLMYQIFFTIVQNSRCNIVVAPMSHIVSMNL